MGTQSFEQQITMYHNISLYCGIAAIIFLVAAIVLFFVLKIPKVLGELTGRTTRKAIDEMIAENASTGNLTSNKLAEDGRRRRRGRTGALGTGRLRRKGNTGELATCKISQETPAYHTDQNYPMEHQDIQGSNQTDVLNGYGSAPTDVLDNYGETPTDVLDNYGSAPTDVLSSYGSDATSYNTTFNHDVPYNTSYQPPQNETMVLSHPMNPATEIAKPVFVIERSIVEIHTDEVI